MHNLALCYADGHGIARSRRWARYWMRRDPARAWLRAGASEPSLLDRPR